MTRPASLVARAAALGAVTLGAVALGVVAPRRARAQEAPAPRPWQFGVWVAAAPRASFLTRAGEWHRDFYMVGVRAERVIAEGPAARLHHVVEGPPYSVLGTR